MEYYAYDEPITGLTETSQEYTASQTIVMSEKNAIDSWRSMYRRYSLLPDAAVLDEFIVCNYAYKINPISKLDEHK
jgi:hypothetical protein